MATTAVPAAVPRPRLARPGWGCAVAGTGRRHAARRARGHPRDPRRGRADARPGRRPRAAVLAATAGGLFGVLVTLVPRGARAGATVGILRGAGRRRRGRAGDRRDRLVRARPQPAGGPAGRLRAGLPGLRDRGRDPLRRDPVPPVGRAPDRRRARDLAAGADRAGARPRSPSSRWPGSMRSVTPLAVDLDAGAVDRAGHRARVDRPGRRRGDPPGGHRARPRLLDRRRRRGHHPGLRRARSGGRAAGPSWVLAFVVARSAFAAWVAGVRAGFWTGRVADLRGWARRSPILAVAFLADRRSPASGSRGWRRSMRRAPGEPVARPAPGDAGPARDARCRSSTTGGCSRSAWRDPTGRRSRWTPGGRA